MARGSGCDSSIIGAVPIASKNGQKRRKETRETPLIQSLDRGLLILEAVGKSTGPINLNYLAELLGIDRSSAFRLANTLKRRGFLTDPSAGKDYVLGPSVWRLSRQYDWSRMLVRVAHEHPTRSIVLASILERQLAPP